jgi:hypothetical protein
VRCVGITRFDFLPFTTARFTRLSKWIYFILCVHISLSSLLSGQAFHHSAFFSRWVVVFTTLVFMKNRQWKLKRNIYLERCSFPQDFMSEVAVRIKRLTKLHKTLQTMHSSCQQRTYLQESIPLFR